MMFINENDEYLLESKREDSKVDGEVTQLLIHLIKMKYQPDMQTKSWLVSIRTHFNNLYKYRNYSKYKKYINMSNDDFFDEIYRDAAGEASREMSKSSVETYDIMMSYDQDKLYFKNIIDKDFVNIWIDTYIYNSPAVNYLNSIGGILL